MKRFLALLLCFSFVISMGAIDSANVYAESDDVYADEVALMNTLKIINENVDYANDTVTRENFALYTARLFKLSESDKRFYTDVQPESYSAGAINALAESGILAQDQDLKFRPADYITKAEACSILIKAMKYQTYAESLGTYPTSYLLAAKRFDIISDTEDTIFKVSEAAHMLYKTMLCYPASVLLKGDEKYIISSENILEEYWKMYSESGTVQAVQGLAATKNVSAKENEIFINNIKYEIPDGIDYRKYIGSYIDFIYEKTNDGIKKIVYVFEREYGKKEMEISVDDFKNYSNGTISYYEAPKKDKLKTVTLNKPVIVYNGYVADSDYTKLFESLNKGYINIKDSNNDGTYDTIIITDYKNIKVGYKNDDSTVIGNSFDNIRLLDLNDYDVTDIQNEQGVKLNKEDIVVDDILAVAENKAGKYIKIIICRNKISEKISEINYSEKEVKAGSDKYVFDKSYCYSQGIMDKIELGAQYDIYLDCFGKIASLQRVKGTSEYSCLIDVALSDSFDSTIEFKVLSSTGEINILTGAESIKLDGQKIKGDAKSVYSYLKTKINLPEIIIYHTSTDGKVTEVDTRILGTNEDPENSLTAFYGNTDSQRWFNSYRLNAETLISTTASVFCVPQKDSIEDSECAVKSVYNIFRDDWQYFADTYYERNDSGSSDAVLLKYEYSELKQNKIPKSFIVSDVSEQLNKDGMIVTVLSGFADGSSASYEIPSGVDVSGVKTGDILQLFYDVNDNVAIDESGTTPTITKVVDIDKLYSDGTVSWTKNKENPNLYESSYVGYNFYRAENQLSFGYANKLIDGKILLWGYNDAATPSEVAKIEIPVILYERDTKKVKTGSIYDVITYENSANDYSKIIYQTKGGAGRVLYVFN